MAAPTDRSSSKENSSANVRPASGVVHDDVGGEALDHLIDALRDYPRLSTADANTLAARIQDEERVFRRHIFAIPAAAVLVLERWMERRRRRLATG